MNNDNHSFLSFVLGAAIGGAAAYYLFKHKDEIAEKIHDEISEKLHGLEEHLHIDHNALIEKAKNKLDILAENVQSTIHRYTCGEEKASEEEIAAIMEELSRLREEVKALSASAS